MKRANNVVNTKSVYILWSVDCSKVAGNYDGQTKSYLPELKILAIEFFLKKAIANSLDKLSTNNKNNK